EAPSQLAVEMSRRQSARSILGRSSRSSIRSTIGADTPGIFRGFFVEEPNEGRTRDEEKTWCWRWIVAGECPIIRAQYKRQEAPPTRAEIPKPPPPPAESSSLTDGLL
ncbi:hypothetical protein FOZ63_014817, partial [Perkinsus olseni]